ncbi:SusC/RagA family TonB-linked outer membrane protein [Dyadobacter jiangsuensis]
MYKNFIIGGRYALSNHQPGLRFLMRLGLSYIIIAISCIQLMAARPSEAQPLAEMQVTIQLQNEGVRDLFRKIEKQTPLRFAFIENQVDSEARFVIGKGTYRVTELLDRMLGSLHLTYMNTGSMVYIIKNPPNGKEANVPAGNTANDLPVRRPDIKTLPVKGKVTDEKGEPLPGVNVIIKGTQQGTTSDRDGNFSLDVPDENAVLVFSFVGYVSKEIQAIGNKTLIEVSLKVDERSLDEVVVVGYGTQKKGNVIGSVATINAQSVENRSASTLSSSLAGLAAGVNVQATTGRPGADGSSIRIRGTGTLNSTSPLVVIDGVVGSMDAVNPNDVESISVLKDAATAAIYGSLASNGVILITTKKGTKGKTSVNYTVMTSLLRPNNVPEFVTDYARHMRLVNEGFNNLGQASVYSNPTIEKWEAAKATPDALTDQGIPNSVAYPNTNWGKVLFGERRLLQNHNLTLNGGSENTQYLFSVGYLNNPGTMPETGADNVRMRINLQSKVAKFLTVGTQTFGDLQNTSVADVATAYSYLTQTVPGVYPVYQGKYGFPAAAEESATANNAMAWLYSQGGNNRVSRINTTLFAKLDLFKGLEFESKVHYNQGYTENNTHPVPYEKWNFATNTLSTAAQPAAQMTTRYSLYKSRNMILDNVLRYNREFTHHEIGALAGYNQQYFNQYNFDASKQGLTHPDLTTLNSGTTMTGINGDETDYGLKSVFGRLNYSFKKRYLAEAVFRYDGSSRFGESSRWGFFPAFSAGWRISEEAFMQPLTDIFDDIRIRASWGRTGNNAAGNYDHLPAYGTVNYSFNNTAIKGLAQTKTGNRNLRWETTTTTNIGLSGFALRRRLNFELDLYKGFTDGILFAPNVPLIVGTASPATMNIAEVTKRGIEISLGYQDRINEFQYSISGNFAYNTNRVDTYKGQLQEGYADVSGNRVYQSNIGTVSTGGTERILEGHAINELYLYPVYKGSGNYRLPDGSLDVNGGPRDGMIRTAEDLTWLRGMVDAGYRFQPADGIDPTKIWYGDLIYADTNGDGIYGNVYDQQFTGKRATPSINYGLSLNLSYRGFDLSMIWSGAAGMHYYWNTIYLNQSIVAQGKSVPALVADNHYYYNESNASDPANNLSGHYPRLKGVTDAQNGRASNYYLYNASFAKLRNLQLGYTFPNRLTNKLAMSKLRVYLAGENLLTLTKFPGLDPEIGPNPNYPTMRQFSLGLNVSF